MSAGRTTPDDFGLDPLATLSHVGDPTPAIDHAPSWNRWLKVVREEPRPVLVRRESGGTDAREPDASDPSADHAFTSLGGVRIGCRLVLPPRGVTVRCGIAVCHGYGAAGPLAESEAAYAERRAAGAAVLLLRVRGFPGSQLDEPAADERGWVCRGLDDPDESPASFLRWIYAQAIADVFNGCRALRWWLNGHAGALAPLYLGGESFGGGLAVAAAAKLVGRPDSATEIDRLVIGLPSMGDWPWRHEHHASPGSNSMGADVARLLDARPELAEVVRSRLRVADSVVIAGRVRCPVLCKLAEADETVPAPSAASVFNALGVDPGRKWRFVVPHGHAETGIQNARRHVAFAALANAFLDPDRRPEEVMQSLRETAGTSLGGKGRAAEPGSSASLFGADADPAHADAQLIAAYERAGRTLDDLPYTDAFEEIFTTVAKALNKDRRGVLARLLNLRKAGKLPRLGRGSGGSVRLEPGEEHRLELLVIDSVGALGQRDKLAYTRAFDDLVARFNEEAGRSLTPHDVWRVIAKIAK
ncbi:MAG: acetylxylan esterase [Planctomycetota bacterium]